MRTPKSPLGGSKKTKMDMELDLSEYLPLVFSILCVFFEFIKNEIGQLHFACSHQLFEK